MLKWLLIGGALLVGYVWLSSEGLFSDSRPTTTTGTNTGPKASPGGQGFRIDIGLGLG